jgi:hypothetical protein
MNITNINIYFCNKATINNSNDKKETWITKILKIISKIIQWF